VERHVLSEVCFLFLYAIILYKHSHILASSTKQEIIAGSPKGYFLILQTEPVCSLLPQDHFQTYAFGTFWFMTLCRRMSEVVSASYSQLQHYVVCAGANKIELFNAHTCLPLARAELEVVSNFSYLVSFLST